MKEHDTGNWDLSMLPKGKVWATPAKSSGYLRSSFLGVIGRIRDIELPEDLDSDNNSIGTDKEDLGEFRWHTSEMARAIKT